VVDLQYVTVRYGGGNGHGAVLFSGCDGTITDSAVEYSSSWGIYRQGASPTVANITYAGNTSGDLY